jgi:hypothetical protein
MDPQCVGDDDPADVEQWSNQRDERCAWSLPPGPYSRYKFTRLKLRMTYLPGVARPPLRQ